MGEFLHRFHGWRRAVSLAGSAKRLQRHCTKKPAFWTEKAKLFLHLTAIGVNAFQNVFDGYTFLD
jgi:hypothetical protein